MRFKLFLTVCHSLNSMKPRLLSSPLLWKQ